MPEKSSCLSNVSEMSRRFNQTQELDHFNKDELLAMKSMIEEKI
jgi:hypothetical protein